MHYFLSSYKCGEHLCLRWFVSAQWIAYEYSIDYVTATWIMVNLVSPKKCTLPTIFLKIVCEKGGVFSGAYYSAWADQRHRMQSYMAYTPHCCARREYIAESGMYIWQFTTAAQRNGIFLFLQWNGQFPYSPR